MQGINIVLSYILKIGSKKSGDNEARYWNVDEIKDFNSSVILKVYGHIK